MWGVQPQEISIIRNLSEIISWSDISYTKETVCNLQSRLNFFPILQPDLIHYENDGLT
jgi:hypothetical protein